MGSYGRETRILQLRIAGVSQSKSQVLEEQEVVCQVVSVKKNKPFVLPFKLTKNLQLQLWTQFCLAL